MKTPGSFGLGARAILPVLTGVIPFGAVMGAVAAEAGLSLFQTMAMDWLVYAGAAQLAATELMSKHAASAVVVATGLVINLRFLLYNAALSPALRKFGFPIKLVSAYMLTDQAYAVMSADQSRLREPEDEVRFYLGASVVMAVAWHASVAAGHVFGNFAPASWALDFAVPLSFLALLMPTLRNRRYVAVAAFSAVVSILLHPMPYRLGLVTTALLAIGLAMILIRKGTTA